MLVSPRRNQSSSWMIDLKCRALGGDGGEARLQIEAHLVAEDAAGADAGAILLARAVVPDVPQEIEILFHDRSPPPLLPRERAGMVGAVASVVSSSWYANQMNTAPRMIIGALSTCPMVTQSKAR